MKMTSIQETVHVNLKWNKDGDLSDMEGDCEALDGTVCFIDLILENNGGGQLHIENYNVSCVENDCITTENQEPFEAWMLDWWLYS